MADTQSPFVQPQEPAERARQIDAVAWAVLIIWVGLVMLMGVPWAWFLIGVSVLMLGTQMMRRQSNLAAEPFGVAIGLIFFAGGVWDLLELPMPLVPIMLIALGGYLLRRAIWPETRQP
jgi:hypothetical protein